MDQDSSMSIDTFQGSYISNLVSSSMSIQIEYPTDAFDAPSLPLNTSVVWIHEHRPSRVSKVIDQDVSSYIALVNDSSVLEYLKQPEGSKIQIDPQILETLGNHPRIIRCHGLTKHGLLFDKRLCCASRFLKRLIKSMRKMSSTAISLV
jgi:hypothetical protein